MPLTCKAGLRLIGSVLGLLIVVWKVEMRSSECPLPVCCDTGNEIVTDMGGVNAVDRRIHYAKHRNTIGQRKWQIIRLHLLAVNHLAVFE